MALINCPECNHEISDQAQSCPHCGYPLKPVASAASEQTKQINQNIKYLSISLGSIVFIIAVALLISHFVGMPGWEPGKPDDISSQHYQYALKAIEYVDQYLDYDVSVYEAYNLLDNLRNQSSLPETEFGDVTHRKNYNVEFSVTMITHTLLSMHSDAVLNISDSTDRYDEILEHRNELAEVVGEKKR